MLYSHVSRYKDKTHCSYSDIGLLSLKSTNGKFVPTRGVIVAFLKLGVL